MASQYTLVITLTPDQLASQVEPIFRDKCNSLFREFKVTLNSPLFAWDSVTKRKNGETVGDPRNAIDLGGLVNSQTLTFIDSRNAVINWDAPYTQKVFDHATQDLVAFTLERMR